MQHVLGLPPRSTITETADGVELVVPVRPLGAMKILSATVGLVAWTLAGLAVLRSVIRYEDPLELFVRVLLVACLALWIAIIVVIVASLTWASCGRERIRFARQHLDHRCEIGFIGRSRRYERDDVRRLRVVPDGGGDPSHLLALPFTVRGALKFDHGLRVVTLAEGLDEPRARSIVRLLGERALVHVEPT